MKITVNTFVPAYPSEEAHCTDRNLYIFPLTLGSFASRELGEMCEGEYSVTIEGSLPDSGFQSQQKSFTLECGEKTTVNINYN